MCLAVPGLIVSIREDEPLLRPGRVRFGGVMREISLALVPEAEVGDHVVVHAGVAISRLDQAQAAATLAELEAMGALEASVRELSEGQGLEEAVE